MGTTVTASTKADHSSGRPRCWESQEGPREVLAWIQHLGVGVGGQRKGAGHSPIPEPLLGENGPPEFKRASLQGNLSEGTFCKASLSTDI